MLVLRSKSTDLWRHLAVEEHLLAQVQPDEPILFLWQSPDAVVIGKNQNPWRECRLSLMTELGVVMARRLSGGGAVFHDGGNLNYSFIVPRTAYQSARQYDVVIAALGSLGLRAELSGKTSLAVEGRKVSGNAFCFRGGGALHHGTLLVSSDLDKLHKCLQVATRPIRTRAVPSRPAHVANLAEFDRALTVDRVADALTEAFVSATGGTPVMAGDEYIAQMSLVPLRGKYLSWQWCYGMTPPFELELEDEFPWGEVRVSLYIDRAMIADIAVAIEGPFDESAEDIEQILRDCLYDTDEIAGRLNLLGPLFEPGAAREFAFWLTNP